MAKNGQLISDLARRVGVLETEAKYNRALAEAEVANLRKWLGKTYSRSSADEVRPIVDRLELALGQTPADDDFEEIQPVHPPVDKPMPVDLPTAVDDEVPF